LPPWVFGDGGSERRRGNATIHDCEASVSRSFTGQTTDILIWSITVHLFRQQDNQPTISIPNAQLTRTPPSTPPNNSNPRWIASKRPNMPLNPPQRCPLIQQPNIRLPILPHLSARKEPINAQPVLQRNINHRSVRSVDQSRARDRVGASLSEAAAVDHDQHWE